MTKIMASTNKAKYRQKAISGDQPCVCSSCCWNSGDMEPPSCGTNAGAGPKNISRHSRHKRNRSPVSAAVRGFTTRKCGLLPQHFHRRINVAGSYYFALISSAYRLCAGGLLLLLLLLLLLHLLLLLLLIIIIIITIIICPTATAQYVTYYTRKSCYHKDDRVMHPIAYMDALKIFGSPCMATPTANFPDIFNGLLFWSIPWLCVQNLKFAVTCIAR